MPAKNYDHPSPPDRFVAEPEPNLAHPDPFRRLVAIMDRLRGPGGCPWDREQTHETLKQYLIEEAYEVLGAIEERDDPTLCEELGDVALQVVFHAQLAAEEERFNVDDVYRAICEKLIRRHPHVFGETLAEDAGQVLRNWEQIKLAEREEKARRKRAAQGEEGEPLPVAHVFKGIPKHLPALQRAARVQEKAARVGFDWPSLKPVLEKVREELDELMAELDARGIDDRPNPHLDPARLGTTGGSGAGEGGNGAGEISAEIEEEFGDLLFAMVNAARFLGIEPEDGLQRATNKFMKRYALMEKLAAEAGEDWGKLTLDEMDRYWEAAKKRTRGDDA